MKKYLLDTNMCIFYIKGQYNLHAKISEIGDRYCYISEVTVAELKYGVQNSSFTEKNQSTINEFIADFAVILMYNSLNIYAQEKARLKRSGTIIPDFDILIGSTAINNDMVMVTNNVAHFNRLENIIIEDWTK